MSDIKLFQVGKNAVEEISGTSVAVEKSLQELIEKHLEAFLGVRFLASEYATGRTHGGRIDTLGIDENGCPVIIEYKRALNQNVINQGLFYLDWLLDHKAEFKLRVMDMLGKPAADAIEWSTPRLLCIAGDFTKYDEHAIQQINRNIELIRYRRYGDGLLLFELVNATVTQETLPSESSPPPRPKQASKTVSQYLTEAPKNIIDLFDGLKEFLLALGDDIQVNTLKHYIAFKRIKNFACVEVFPNAGLQVFVKADLSTVELKKGFTEDVSNVGHFGTGNLRIRILTQEDLEKAKPLLTKSYEVS
jgi:predicted transport protein